MAIRWKEREEVRGSEVATRERGMWVKARAVPDKRAVSMAVEEMRIAREADVQLSELFCVLLCLLIWALSAF